MDSVVSAKVSKFTLLMLLLQKSHVPKATISMKNLTHAMKDFTRRETLPLVQLVVLAASVENVDNVSLIPCWKKAPAIVNSAKITMQPLLNTEMDFSKK